MTWTVYDLFRLAQNNGSALDLDNPSGTLKVAWLKPAYTPAIATDEFYDDVSTHQVTGTNYTAGGNAVTTPILSHNTGSGLIDWDFNDPASWSQHASGFSDGRHALLYHDTGTPGTSRLIAYHTEGANVGNVAGDLTVEIDAGGAIQWPR